MKMNRKSALFVPACLAAGGFAVSTVLLVGLSISPGFSGVAGDGPVQEIVPSEQALVVADFEMPPARDFLEIVSRPIFAPDRRPTQQEEISILTVASELELRLVGVVVAAGAPMAIVAPRGSSAFARLTVGDRFQGWTVALIEPQSVTFRRDNAVERLELSYDVPSKVPPRASKEQTAAETAEKKVQD